MIRKVLTIAGSDCSGGAGIQADIKTITAHRMYAMSAVTALTAQNTTGVYGILEVPPEFLEKQLDCIFKDITPDAVKIGMVSSRPAIGVIARKLRQYNARNIVIDPVMLSTSGTRLLSDGAKDALITQLLPLAAVITPNIPEAEALCSFEIRDQSDMVRAGRDIAAGIFGAVLLKGGHLAGDATDVLIESGIVRSYTAVRVDNPNTHGTGCTLSSAIACNLADGKSLDESIRAAKTYLTGAIKAMLNLGQGPGPLDHTYRIR